MFLKGFPAFISRFRICRLMTNDYKVQLIKPVKQIERPKVYTVYFKAEKRRKAKS